MLIQILFTGATLILGMILILIYRAFTIFALGVKVPDGSGGYDYKSLIELVFFNKEIKNNVLTNALLIMSLIGIGLTLIFVFIKFMTIKDEELLKPRIVVQNMLKAVGFTIAIPVMIFVLNFAVQSITEIIYVSTTPQTLSNPDEAIEMEFLISRVVFGFTLNADLVPHAEDNMFAEHNQYVRNIIECVEHSYMVKNGITEINDSNRQEIEKVVEQYVANHKTGTPTINLFRCYFYGEYNDMIRGGGLTEFRGDIFYELYAVVVVKKNKDVEYLTTNIIPRLNEAYTSKFGSSILDETLANGQTIGHYFTSEMLEEGTKTMNSEAFKEFAQALNDTCSNTPMSIQNKFSQMQELLYADNYDMVNPFREFLNGWSKAGLGLNLKETQEGFWNSVGSFFNRIGLTFKAEFFALGNIFNYQAIFVFAVLILLVKSTGNGLLQSGKRFADSVLLIVVMPLALSTYPLDNGHRAKKNFQMLISKMLTGLTILIAFNVYFSLISIVGAVRVSNVTGLGEQSFTFQESQQFIIHSLFNFSSKPERVGYANLGIFGIVYVIIMITGALMIKTAPTLLGSLISEEASAMARDDMSVAQDVSSSMKSATNLGKKLAIVGGGLGALAFGGTLMGLGAGTFGAVKGTNALRKLALSRFGKGARKEQRLLDLVNSGKINKQQFDKKLSKLSEKRQNAVNSMIDHRSSNFKIKESQQEMFNNRYSKYNKESKHIFGKAMGGSVKVLGTIGNLMGRGLGIKRK